MAASGFIYREIRFVIEDELTQVYIALEAWGDSPINVQGWHHKTFPKSIPVAAIFEKIFKEGDDPVLWPLNAPK